MVTFLIFIEGALIIILLGKIIHQIHTGNTKKKLSFLALYIVLVILFIVIYKII